SEEPPPRHADDNPGADALPDARGPGQERARRRRRARGATPRQPALTHQSGAKRRVVIRAPVAAKPACLRRDLELPHRFSKKIRHFLTYFVVGDGHTLCVEVGADLPEDILVALLGQICLHDSFDVVFDPGSSDSEETGSPLAQHLVASGLGLELELLVMRELLLESLLALFE